MRAAAAEDVNRSELPMPFLWVCFAYENRKVKLKVIFPLACASALPDREDLTLSKPNLELNRLSPYLSQLAY
jgi:hypothetical protein